jgi:hypothetical protein
LLHLYSNRILAWKLSLFYCKAVPHHCSHFTSSLLASFENYTIMGGKRHSIKWKEKCKIVAERLAKQGKILDRATMNQLGDEWLLDHPNQTKNREQLDTVVIK